MDGVRRAAALLLAWLVVAVVGASCGAGGSGDSPAIDGKALLQKIEGHLSTDPAHDQLRALLVQIGERTVVEKYYEGSTAKSAWDIESVTKSIVSTLVGIAIAGGDLPGVEATLGELLPDRRARMSPAAGATSLRQVLSMSGGFPEDDIAVPRRWQTARDPVAHILAAHDPGLDGFAYSNQGAHLLAAILTEATGMPLLDYAREVLFDPLGIDTRPAFTGRASDENLDAWTHAGVAWPVDRAGIHLGWGLVKLTGADLLKLGRLYVDEGRWNGAQLVPKGWVREATREQADAPLSDGYGYEWWVTEADGDPAYFAAGFGGQLVEVVPDRDLVVVMLTEINPLGDGSEGLDIGKLSFMVSDVIAPAAG
jgi:CubicO group peptidase (beta-lactamase class C family)